MNFTIPHPPSVNHYYRIVGGNALISEEGRTYRRNVHAALYLLAPKEPMAGKLTVTILWTPPDNRRRDCDNILKAALDSMQHAGLYVDDSQIVELSIKKMPPVKPGRLDIQIDMQ